MQEQFRYSLMASGLGILIVFSILLLLCGLMILIKKIAEPEQKAKNKVQTQPALKANAIKAPSIPIPVLVAAATAGTAAGSIEWIGASIAAYLAIEDEEDASAASAKAWAYDKYSKYDPWVANNKLSKTVPGV